MCGRYTVIAQPEEIRNRFNVQVDLDFSQKYNAAPGQKLPVVTDADQSKIQMFHWGFLPFWAKSKGVGYKMINARGEKIETTRAFKESFEKRRCIIPADGFFEWKKVKTETGTVKTPYRMTIDNKELFSMAGVWTKNKYLGDEPIYSYAIITVDAAKSIAGFHHRMPVILNKDQEKIWLNPESTEAELKKLLKTYQKDIWFDKCSIAVNNPANDYKEILNEE